MTIHAWITEVLAYLGAGCTLAAFSMKRMIPLRIAGIVGNVISIGYGISGLVVPSILLHSILLPLNIIRLRQMIRLSRGVRVAASGKASVEWLEGFMSSRRYKSGEVLFRKGDPAKEMFYIVSGSFHLPELDVGLAPGEIIGELGIVSPGNVRTQTIACVGDGEVLAVSYDQVRELYYQNPKFGFDLLRLIGARLHYNLERAQPPAQMAEVDC